jgi:2-keto-4-pentenoate hydratase/2-oxohepta-3-ene-1,7-dioic acid hydratase in catechol pathway
MMELLEMGSYGVAFIADLESSIRAIPDVHDAPWAFSPDEVEFLAPVPKPGKVVAIGANRGNRAIDPLDPEIQDYWPRPQFFLKASNAVCGHNTTIKAWQVMRPVQIEGELCLIIGKRARNVKREDAWAYVAGISLLNDVSAGRFGLQDGATLQIGRSDGKPPEPMVTRHMARAKNPDGYCPIGPWMVPLADLPVDVTELEVVTEVGPNVVQRGKLPSYRFTPEHCLEEVTKWMTLDPGDILSCGAFDQMPDFPLRNVDLATDGGQTSDIWAEHVGHLITHVELQDGDQGKPELSWGYRG